MPAIFSRGDIVLVSEDDRVIVTPDFKKYLLMPDNTIIMVEKREDGKIELTLIANCIETTIIGELLDSHNNEYRVRVHRQEFLPLCGCE